MSEFQQESLNQETSRPEEKKKGKKKLPLSTKIFIALALGIVVGLLFMGNPDFADSYIKPFGTIFLNLVKFIVVPIVFFSIISGVISLSDIRKVGQIGVRTIVYYLCTTAGAVFIGLFISNIFKGLYTVISVSGLEYEAAEAPSFMDTIVNIFPSNIIEPFANATMLQVIVASLLFGFGIILAGEKGIALVAGVDRIFDMGRTTVNITGDAACSLIVSHFVDKKEKKKAA